MNPIRNPTLARNNKTSYKFEKERKLMRGLNHKNIIPHVNSKLILNQVLSHS